MKNIDVRGLSCPEPVIRARRAVEKMQAGDQVEIIVETGASRENVLRAVRSLGCDAASSDFEDGFRILATKS